MHGRQRHMETKFERGVDDPGPGWDESPSTQFDAEFTLSGEAEVGRNGETALLLGTTFIGILLRLILLVRIDAQFTSAVTKESTFKRIHERFISIKAILAAIRQITKGVHPIVALHTATIHDGERLVSWLILKGFLNEFETAGENLTSPFMMLSMFLEDTSSMPRIFSDVVENGKQSSGSKTGFIPIFNVFSFLKKDIAELYDEWFFQEMVDVVNGFSKLLTKLGYNSVVFEEGFQILTSSGRDVTGILSTFSAASQRLQAVTKMVLGQHATDYFCSFDAWREKDKGYGFDTGDFESCFITRSLSKESHLLVFQEGKLVCLRLSAQNLSLRHAIMDNESFENWSEFYAGQPLERQPNLRSLSAYVSADEPHGRRLQLKNYSLRPGWHLLLQQSHQNHGSLSPVEVCKRLEQYGFAKLQWTKEAYRARGDGVNQPLPVQTGAQDPGGIPVSKHPQLM